ncbi:MAG: basic amino acid ABC transporter substrate-binding protein [Lachnospiraceae bacterium]|nr:basic amino acid ABC transporter substrate-binding protein [Lachnospiraceae bacterium]
MKKFIKYLLLTACLGLFISGCSSSGADGASAKDTLIVATNAEFPPYEYYENNEIVGIDIDIIKAVAEDIGMKVQIEDMAFDSVIASIQSGKSDVGIAGLTITEDRLENVNFSIPYTETQQVVIVNENSDIVAIDDLKNRSIGVQLGTTGDIFAEDVEGATVERYNKGMEAIQALRQGKIDAVIIDKEPAKVFVSQNNDIEMLDEDFVVEEYAIAIGKDNTELLEKINASLEKLKDSGKLKEIADKYITAE